MSIPLTPREMAIHEEQRQAIATTEIANESEPLGEGWMSFAGKGSWANQACAVGVARPVTEAELDRLVEFYVERGVEPRIEICTFAHATLIAGLAARGFVLREFENVLTRTLDQNEDYRNLHPFGWPAELEIDRVDPRDPQQVEQHVRVTMSGFVENPSESMLESGRRTTRHPRTLAFNARIGDQIAGTGAMEISALGAALFGVTVRPEYRRRGLQAALILERLQWAQQRGCRFAAIHSRPGIPTERNAARIGFQLCYTKVVLAKPGEGLEAAP